MALRKFTPCLRYFSRVFSHNESKIVPRTYTRMCFNRCIRSTPKQNFTASAHTSQLETVLQNGSFNDAIGSTNKETDVYLYGMPFQTTKEQIETFFEGLDIDEICHIDTSRSAVKEIFYVRFKNEESKNKALEKHNDKIGSRYVEVFGNENFGKLALSMLFNRSTMVKLDNLPFNCEKEQIIQWFKPVNVDAEDVLFIKRGTCVVELHDESSVCMAHEKKLHTVGIGGRRVFLTAFVSRDDMAQMKNFS